MTAYRIKDWNEHFENNRTRELKHMDWVPVKNKMDGDGYTELVDHASGAAHLGAWLAIVEIASRCDPRGTLLRDGATPHDFTSLSRISRLPAVLFEIVIPRLLKIGWLEPISLETQEVTQIPQEGAGTSAQSRMTTRESDHGTEGNGREGNGKKDSSQAASPPDEPDAPIEFPVFPVVGSAKTWTLADPALVKALQDSYPAVAYEAEARKAHAWCVSNPRNRKTPAGMSKFLNGWFSRAQNKEPVGNRPFAMAYVPVKGFK